MVITGSLVRLQPGGRLGSSLHSLAGNSGPSCSTTGSPGDNWHSFATGATDVNDVLGGFSSRGPAAFTGFLKPQIISSWG